MAAQSEGTHSYYDWQISTLMLAYDAIDPLPRDDNESIAKREEQVQREVRDLAMAVIPPDYQRDESREFPPELVVQMTRATLKRASEIVGLR
ncbi:MAG: hypothetical protein AAGK78_12450 [Planctomycetota bacterium]